MTDARTSSLKRVLAAAAAGLMVGIGPAAGQETENEEDDGYLVGPLSRVGNYPQISVAVPFQINNDYTYDSDDSSDFNVLSTDTEPLVTISLIEPNPETLVLNTLLVIQSVKDPPEGEDSYFEDTGLFIQDLNLAYGNARWEIMGGKFTPNFGRAWNLAPDVYGQDLPGDYEYDEQIGFGGFYTLGDGSAGFHTLSGSAFFQDDTVLSESLFTNRGRNKTSDGGVGNTGKIDNFVIAYDGEALPVIPGILDYQLGFVRRSDGKGDETAEKGYVASVDASFPLQNDVETTLDGEYSELNPLIEFVYFDDFEGVEGQDSYYLTGSLDLVLGDWDFGTAYTLHQTDPPGGGSNDEHIFTLQGGFTFRNGFQIEVGWNINDIGGGSSQTLGTQLTYEYDF